jgi:hypothetical protein
MGSKKQPSKIPEMAMWRRVAEVWLKGDCSIGTVEVENEHDPGEREATVVFSRTAFVSPRMDGMGAIADA